MRFHQWVSVGACAGLLGLGLLSAFRSTRSPLALPLAVLCIDFFGWTFAALAYEMSGAAAWHLIDLALSPLTFPLVLHFALVFVGERKRLSWLLYTVYACFGALSCSAVLTLAPRSAMDVVWGRAWMLSYQSGIVAVMAAVVALLVAHMRREEHEEERARTRLLLASFSLGTCFCSTDLLSALGLPLPRLANVGALLATGFMAIVAFRRRLFESELPALAAAAAFGVAAVSVLAYVAALRWVGAGVWVWVLAASATFLVVAAILRHTASAARAERQRRVRMAALGRMADQMAHDLKNPLAALKGAVQFLQQELAHGRSVDPHADLLDVLVAQVDRLDAIIDRYRSVARVAPKLEALRVNDVVRCALALHALEADHGVRVHVDLCPSLDEVRADADLFGIALQNLFRNAIEAMPGGGTLAVRTEPGPSGRGACVVVEDTGEGMDARTLERAFDDFFTTKAQGSGLGLAHVKRIAEAHGGDVTLASVRGRGTRARMYIPPWAS